LTISDGEKYEGVFKDGKREGDGEYYWTNGNHYKGELKNYKQHGQGI